MSIDRNEAIDKSIMIIETVKTSKLGQLKNEWNKLYEQGKSIWNYSIYQSYESALIQEKSYYWNPRRWRYTPLFIYCKVRQEGFPASYVGGVILPLAVDSRKRVLTSYYCYSQNEYIDLVTNISDANILYLVFKECLNDYSDYIFHFSNLQEKGAMASLFVDTLKFNRSCKDTCVYIPIEDDYNSYYHSLSKHQRQNLRTAYNKFQKERIDWRLMEYDCNSPIPNYDLRKLEIMYNNRYIEKNKKKINLFRRILHKKADSLYRLLHESNKAVFFVLYIGNEPAAYVAGFFSDNSEKFIVPRLSISNQYRRYSVGIILINEIIKNLIPRSLKVFDLAGGSEPYKYAMGGHDHYRYEISGKIIDLLNS